MAFAKTKVALEVALADTNDTFGYQRGWGDQQQKIFRVVLVEPLYFPPPQTGQGGSETYWVVLVDTPVFPATTDRPGRLNTGGFRIHPVFVFSTRGLVCEARYSYSSARRLSSNPIITSESSGADMAQMSTTRSWASLIARAILSKL